MLKARMSRQSAKRYKQVKLTADFKKKRRYKTHYMNLKQFLEHGLLVGKCHKVIAFKQSRFALSFLDKMTKMRSSSKTSFQAKLFKGIANNIYGKR